MVARVRAVAEMAAVARAAVQEVEAGPAGRRRDGPAGMTELVGQAAAVMAVVGRAAAATAAEATAEVVLAADVVEGAGAEWAAVVCVAAAVGSEVNQLGRSEGCWVGAAFRAACKDRNRASRRCQSRLLR